VACSEVGASGIHFRRVLDRLGISDAMKPKLKVVKGATRTASLVAKGEAEIAVQMISELKPISGVDVVGPLPGELHFEIVLTAGLSQNAKNPEGARRLIEFLERPSTAPVYAKAGMERI
jgi:molybdate transport system substrate-binding protein